MPDPSLYSQIKAQVQQQQPQFPEQEHLKCPRCDSTNTKFCYYNNYNLSQPRHFCKNCRRYWTKGGALRNIPVGGGSRKNSKRSSAAAKRPAPPPTSTSKNESRSSNGDVSETLPATAKGENVVGQFENLLEAGGSFSSLLGCHGGHYGNFLDGLGLNGPSLHTRDPMVDPGPGQNLDQQAVESDSNNSAGGGLLSIHGGDGGGGCWSGGTSGWPDLSMYTPGSTFL